MTCSAVDDGKWRSVPRRQRPVTPVTQPLQSRGRLIPTGLIVSRVSLAGQGTIFAVGVFQPAPFAGCVLLQTSLQNTEKHGA